MKNKNRFKRGYCKIRKYDLKSYNDSRELAEKSAETGVLPPHKTIEIETNKYFVAIDFYDSKFFYGFINDSLENYYGKGRLDMPSDFLQFRKKGSKEWQLIIFADRGSDAISVIDFLPEKFVSQYPHIKWEKMKRTILEEAIENACATEEDMQDEILNYA